MQNAKSTNYLENGFLALQTCFRLVSHIKKG